MSYVVPISTAKGGHVAPFHHTKMPYTNSTEQRPMRPTLLPEWGCVKCVQRIAIKKKKIYVFL